MFNDDDDTLDYPDLVERRAKEAAGKWVRGEQMTEEDWEVLHDHACTVLQELDMDDEDFIDSVPFD